MIVPRFAASQNENAVTLVVRVPHVRVSAAEVAVSDGCIVSFWCKPYLLKLQLPAPVVDDERLTAVYDPEDANGTVTISLPKAVPGQHFADLDIAARLLAPRLAPPVSRLSHSDAGAVDFDLTHIVQSTEEGSERSAGKGTRAAHRDALVDGFQALAVDDAAAKSHGIQRRSGPPLIEVLDDGMAHAPHDRDRPAMMSAETSDCVQVEAERTAPVARPHSARVMRGSVPDSLLEIDAAACSPANAAFNEIPSPAVIIRPPHYGFNRRFTGFFAHGLRAEFPSVLSALPYPDDTPDSERSAVRLAREEDDWDGGWRVAGDSDAEGGGGEDAILALAAAASSPGGAAWWLALRPPVVTPKCNARTWHDGVLGAHPAARSAHDAAALATAAAVVADRGDDFAAADVSDPASAVVFSSDLRGVVLSQADTDDLVALPRREYLVDGDIIGTGNASEPAVTATGATLFASSDGLDMKHTALRDMTGAVGAVLPASPSSASSGTTSAIGVTALGSVVNFNRRPERSRLLLSLIPIVAAYAYDVRTTDGEPTVESGRTIADLSPLLAAADDDPWPPLPSSRVVQMRRMHSRSAIAADIGVGQETSVSATHAVDMRNEQDVADAHTQMSVASSRRLAQEARRDTGCHDDLPHHAETRVGSGASTTVIDAASVASVAANAAAAAAVRSSVVSFCRRALLYPYLRRWDLSTTCARDAGELMAHGGVRAVLKALLAVRRALASGGDGLYLLNTLYIDDYCAWLLRDSASDADVRSVGAAVLSLVLPVTIRLAGTTAPSAERTLDNGNLAVCHCGQVQPVSPDDAEFAGWRLSALLAGVVPPGQQGSTSCSSDSESDTKSVGSSEADSDSESHDSETTA